MNHVETFAKEGLEDLAAFKRELSDSIRYSEVRDEGIYSNQKEMTFDFLETKYPGYDFSCFEDLSLSQYKTICKMILDNKEFDEIKAFIENDEEEN